MMLRQFLRAPFHCRGERKRKKTNGSLFTLNHQNSGNQTRGGDKLSFFAVKSRNRVACFATGMSKRGSCRGKEGKKERKWLAEERSLHLHGTNGTNAKAIRLLSKLEHSNYSTFLLVKYVV